ncbi:putative rhamnosyl transferase [Roseivivax sediminis]|uniref:Rhamnosyl transferase n=1 Tax=Roseivivax sediminis TaxID=936889 RepID=A0A1I2EPS4_9RHOB|nr:putative rhamnosyl transferase [Roseivivax sediminis]SFE94458.1 Putative rhamnosyl transferase [Roseivivax sediminis]
MQIIGFCRFSYPAEGGFQVEHASVEDRIAYLYAPERLEERFRHFEAICLPGLMAQTDPDFTFVILVGDAMPDAARVRLEALVKGMPQARIVARPPGPHRAVCQEALNDARDYVAAPCLQFRHDDDDAVAVDFVETLRQAAADVAPLLARHRLVAFDWHDGYVARPGAHGLAAEEVHHPYWGVAQAVAVQGGVRQSIMNFGHQKLPRFMPTLTFSGRAMYVRGHNDHNDSRQKAHVKPVALPRLDATGEARFRDLFAIDADHVRRIFSG